MPFLLDNDHEVYIPLIASSLLSSDIVASLTPQEETGFIHSISVRTLWQTPAKLEKNKCHLRTRHRRNSRCLKLLWEQAKEIFRNYWKIIKFDEKKNLGWGDRWSMDPGTQNL